MGEPSSDDLWFLPLGGTGEIGMNLNLYGHDGKWLMVDCGVSFDEPLQPPYKTLSENSHTAQKHRIVAADPTFISQRKEALSAIIITHAHEDHVGAIPYLWQRFQCPVYATPFTAEILRRKLAQTKLANKVPIVEIEPDTTHQFGPFTVSWLSVTHSLPEPFALKISTPVGSVLHTADWKVDANPITGRPFDVSRFKALSKEHILALVGDSTNATKPGFSISERNCYDGLLSTIRSQKGKVVATCFGSNVARLISLARVAKKLGRYMALYGRSLLNMYGVAKQQGIWPEELTVVDAHHMGYLPSSEVLAVATGSQGERNTALARLADDTHPLLQLEKGDTVVYSAMVIPGNEDSVARVNTKLAARNINVIMSETHDLPIHASGHPCEEELKLMYHWVKPKIAIPVHGEPKHIAAHANVARACGVKITYEGVNGDLYRLAPQPSLRRQVVDTGRIPVLQE